MTDETEKLFDAPFAVMGDSMDYTKFNVIIHCRKSPRYCSTVASCIDQKTAIRFARLPELYEELKSSSYDFCWSCLATLGIDPPTADELVENLCPRKPSFCGYNNRWKLLRKVRDGE